ncbi:D-glycero-alpha-D-manno-heptose-1,7-bisphosphate 7-phosphatase [Halocola ammonii]
MNKAIFLDRDGVINHDPGDYTTSLEEFHILPTVMEALQEMRRKDYQLILITNQGGIAKGIYPEENVREIHKFFVEECKKNGVEITAIYFSPHHDNFGKSLSRKPGSLMVERAVARYNIDPKKSFIIGDKDRDLEAGAGAGVKGIKIETNAPLLDVVPQL